MDWPNFYSARQRQEILGRQQKRNEARMSLSEDQFKAECRAARTEAQARFDALPEDAKPWVANLARALVSAASDIHEARLKLFYREHGEAMTDADGIYRATATSDREA